MVAMVAAGETGADNMMTAQPKTTDTIVRVASGQAFSGGPIGYTARVEPNGDVSVYDDVAGYYTTVHSLTPRQIATVRRMAFNRAQ